MRSWIHDLTEGETAFNNEDPLKRPHQIKNGVVVQNKQKNGDKYRRQIWDKPGPCVHTRNDQLASQNTVHPADDRVFSIRELMMMMTVPHEFKWSKYTLHKLNEMTEGQKTKYLKTEEIKIRQSLGEAVPTEVFRNIAANIKNGLFCRQMSNKEIADLLASDRFSTYELGEEYIRDNPDNLSLNTLMRIAELANTQRTETAAYYTNKSIVTEILNRLPDTTAESIRILEPSVGVGNFIPQIIKRFDSKKITIDVVDIDNKSLETLQMLLKHVEVPESVTINYICDDFLTHMFAVEKYDYIIGNPPFGKLTNRNLGKLQTYRKSAINTETNNICSFFLDKAVRMGTIVALVLPKAVLNIPVFTQTRAYLEKMCVKAILDFGEKGFKGVLVETIALVIEAEKKSWATEVYSMTNSKVIEQRQNYIFDNKLPYWVIYRDDFFDSIYDRLEFDVFSVFRDRQITNAKLNRSGDIRVLKSRNINDDGTEIIDVDGYDAYIDVSEASELSVYKFLDSTTVYLTPNMTYNPRVMKKPTNTLVNGSVAILKPKVGCAPTKKQLLYFSTEEYRRFYKIARNFQTRSLNVDSCSVYFFGLLKEEGKLCLG